MSIRDSCMRKSFIGLIISTAMLATPCFAERDVLAMVQEAGEGSESNAIKDIDSSDERPAYGRAGSREWTVGGLVGAEFGISEIAWLRTGVDWFVQDHFSVGLQFDVGGVWNGGTGYSGTVGVAGILRWHFLHSEDWTVFAEAGTGVAWCGSEIPRGGTRFNFSPQIGVGASWSLAEDLRFRVVIGWYHLSNARTSNRNPGFDGIAVQAGIGIDF